MSYTLNHLTAADLPSRVSVQLIEDRLLTELKHQVEASLPPEDLQQVDQIHMFQLLQAQRTTQTTHVRAQRSQMMDENG